MMRMMRMVMVVAAAAAAAAAWTADEACLADAPRLERRPFVASRHWQAIEAWHEIPAGLDVRLDLDAGTRHARIPDPWKLRVHVELLDLRADVLGTVVWLPTSAADPWAVVREKIARDLLVSERCLASDPELAKLAGAADVETLFHATHGRAYLRARVEGEYACLCGTHEPCRAPRDTLEQCLAARAEWAQMRLVGPSPPADSETVCVRQRAAYYECATKCSAFQDTILANRELFARQEGQSIARSTLVQQATSPSIPGSATSSWCQDCAFAHGVVGFALGKKMYSRARAADAVAWTAGLSRFEPQTRGAGLGRIEAQAATELRCDAYASEPVALVTVRSLVNVHHLLVDLLIPLHETLLRAGMDPARTTVFVDIGRTEERARLQAILREVRSAQGPQALLRLYFRDVHALEALRIASASTTYCFANLFIEVAPLPFAHDGEEAIDPSETAAGADFRRALGARLFRQWPVVTARSAVDGAVTFVKRRGSRKFGNLREAKQIAKEVFGPLGLATKDVVVERLDLGRRWAHFQQTRVLCCVHGQGCANMAFLPERAVVILVMPAGLQAWSWMYSRLASWLGVHLVVHEQLLDPVAGEGWNSTTTHAGLEDPAGAHPGLEQDVVLDPEAWRQTLRRALVALVDG